MSFGFKAQLRAGQIGEIIWNEANRSDLLKLDGFKGDFVWNPTNQKLELKTDFYSMDSTPNFFMERWSDVDSKKPGGPWQSLEHGAELFVYFYIPSLTYFTFNTTELVGRLETMEPQLKQVRVENKSHTTVGYRVPRDTLSDIAQVTELTVIKKPRP